MFFAEVPNKFQFHKVQLTLKVEIKKDGSQLFQFHKVQLTLRFSIV